MTSFAEWQVQEPPQKVAYRYEEFSWGWSDLKVELREFEIVKFTREGMWIKLFELFDDKKWVSLGARKKYACLTKEEALESFVARKKSQVRILDGQLDRAKRALREGEKLMGKYT